MKKKTEVVTLRLEPREKYFAEIAARIQRRSLSNFITWAVEKVSSELLDNQHQKYWDTDDDERLKLLKQHAPELLTFDDDVRLKELEKANG